MAADVPESVRRDLFDAMRIENIQWAGRLPEPEFLSRIFDLGSMPSSDSRFPNAYGDVWQHRVNNWDDWENDWVFSDSRFNLLHCDDEEFLRFLCEVIHPVVRSDTEEVERIRQLFNELLRPAGYEIVERARIAQRPVFAARRRDLPATAVLGSATNALAILDASYVLKQITRMESAVNEDPWLAIGTAKELVETCCTTILTERSVSMQKNLDLPQLVKQTAKELALTPDDIPEKAKAADTIKRLLSNLATITQGIAELRNHYGTGHGARAGAKGLQPRHAKLAVGAASTLAVFFLETHDARGLTPGKADPTAPPDAFGTR